VKNFAEKIENGARGEIFLSKKIREIEKFSTIEKLKTAVKFDCRRAREILKI